MEIIVLDSVEAIGKKAAEIVKETLITGQENFGLATGSSPEGLYKELRESDLDFSQATSVNLDEYVGLRANHPQSYAYFMQEQLFDSKPFKASYLPNGLNSNESDEISRYEAILKEHPIDLQILGIGTNGHIGFNEPGSSFQSVTHKVNLTPSTIEANKRFFESADQVPSQAYSMGIKSIMQAKKIVLIAFGKNKADAIAGMIEGPVTEDLPASILQKHPNVTVLLDSAAASKLS